MGLCGIHNRTAPRLSSKLWDLENVSRFPFLAAPSGVEWDTVGGVEIAVAFAP